MAEITRLLEAWSDGDERARERLFEVVYPELHRLAASKLFAEPHPPSIQATELVNEAYLKLVDQSRVTWQSRAQFLALSATLIRRILLDRAKSRGRVKRGSGQQPLSLEHAEPLVAGQDVELLALDRALVDLARIQP
ncbi:MAG: ECF-type sigma factor, partial [Acidobacteriota bacterium]